MSRRVCLLHKPSIWLDNEEFGEHLDQHTDAELEHWPGGWEKLNEAILASMAESQARRD